MLKFLVFADLHYKKGMYTAPVESLHAILDRAAKENVDFVIHCGDFCNDYKGSPEITDAYLNNRHHLPVYGIYGNYFKNAVLSADKELCEEIKNQNHKQ